MQKKKIVKPVAYKQTLRTIDSYQKALSKGKVISSSTIEEYQKNIKKYVTKSGELRKNISQKSIENFNKIVSEFKKSKFSKISELKKVSEKQERSLVKNNIVEKENVQTFRSLIVEATRRKIKLDSSVIADLSNDVDDSVVDSDDLMKILKHISDAKEFSVTGELQSEFQHHPEADDELKAVQEIIDISNTMNVTDRRRFLHKIEKSNINWKESLIDMSNVKKYLDNKNINKMRSEIYNNPLKWKEITKKYKNTVQYKLNKNIANAKRKSEKLSGEEIKKTIQRKIKKLK